MERVLEASYLPANYLQVPRSLRAIVSSGSPHPTRLHDLSYAFCHYVPTVNTR